MTGADERARMCLHGIQAEGIGCRASLHYEQHPVDVGVAGLYGQACCYPEGTSSFGA